VKGAAIPAQGSIAAPAGVTVAAALRQALPEASWNELRRLCRTGKVTVQGQLALDPAVRLAGGETVAWRLAAPNQERRRGPSVRIVHEDAHLLVIEKPEGVSSVPYERKESGTALDLIREVWRRQGRAATVVPLYVVHRLDKDTSGLICFAKTKLGERGLHRIFKQHLAERSYLAVAHGAVRPGRIESQLIADRGDGLRGSTRRPGEGQRAVTHVEWSSACPPRRSAGCASRPDGPTRSASTWPSRATRWWARRSTCATTCAPAAGSCRPRVCCCTPRCWASPTR
jgi:23S rRNA pseudouridine1911/1915/1917 synthase